MFRTGNDVVTRAWTACLLNSVEQSSNIMDSPLGFDVPDLSETDPQGTRGAPRYACVDCAVLSPVVETSFTLISSRFGWRLHRFREAESGRVMMQWRCPRCWRLFREERRRRAVESFPPLSPSFGNEARNRS